MKLDRIYIEITNKCNLTCSFCPTLGRELHSMSTDDFKKIIVQCAPITNQVFLHVMGEPLSHPNFPEIIELCQGTNVPVQITTNGTVLSQERLKVLTNPIIRQINFSLQALSDNFPDEPLEKLLTPVLEGCRFLQENNPKLYINLRFWNTDESSNNTELDIIERFYNVTFNRRVEVGSIKSKKIGDRLYLHFDTRFVWPDLSNECRGDKGTCHALKSQIAILSDGTVVPCCLDRNGLMDLGNALNEPLDKILNSERAKAIRSGFDRGKLVEELCQHCGYSLRFAKK